MLGMASVCLVSAVAPTHRNLKFRVKCSRKPASKLAALSRCLCPYAKELGSTMQPTGSLVPGEAVPPLADTLQEGGTFSFSASQGILRLCHLLPGLRLLHTCTTAFARLHTGHGVDF